MADTKISALTDGTTPVSTDEFAVARSGANVKLTWDQIQAAVTGDAIPDTLLDAKGDLIVASAADTAARLAVGTNGQVLTADSAESTGVKWATPSGGYEVATFASLPDPTTVTVGRRYTVLGALVTGGACGTVWASDGTLWRPAGGQVIINSETQIDGASGGSTSEQFLFQPLLPAGLLRGVRSIRLRSKVSLSATDTNTRTSRWRIGTAGSSADTAVVSVAMLATIRQTAVPATFGVVSDTAIRQSNLTAGTIQAPDDNVTSTTAHAADVTVPSLTSSALYLSFSVQQGASPSATVSLLGVSIYIE